MKLDEVANADGCPLVQLDEFQIHFRLTDDGALALEGLGEDTEDAVWPVCYPKLDAARRRVNKELEVSGERTTSPFQAARIRVAVRRERQRVRQERDDPKTALGRELKKATGAPTALIDKFVEQEARAILETLGQPQKLH